MNMRPSDMHRPIYRINQYGTLVTWSTFQAVQDPRILSIFFTYNSLFDASSEYVLVYDNSKLTYTAIVNLLFKTNNSDSTFIPVGRFANKYMMELIANIIFRVVLPTPSLRGSFFKSVRVRPVNKHAALIGTSCRSTSD